MKGNELSAADRARLLEAIEINMNYMFTLQTASGRIWGDSPIDGREYHGGIKMTRMPLYALATYADYFKDMDPERAEQAYHNALKTANYVSTHKDGWGPRLKVMVYYHLYKYSGDDTFKQIAISELNRELATFDLHDNSSMIRLHNFPYFEGLYYCVEEFKDHPDRQHPVVQRFRRVLQP